VPSLVDAEGRLPRNPERIAGFEPTEVLAEVENQLDLFRRLVGGQPTHLDSHHHSHRLPVVLEALVEVARRHDLPVRGGTPDVERRLHEAGLATTDRFVDRFFGEDTGVDTLLSVLAEAAPGTTELMCHPARLDDELRGDSTYLEPRERELATLTDPAARRALAEHGITLATFAGIAGIAGIAGRPTR
jgi:hypothetical protein